MNMKNMDSLRANVAKLFWTIDKNSESNAYADITGNLPRFGLKTLVSSAVLTLVLAFGLHLAFKAALTVWSNDIVTPISGALNDNGATSKKTNRNLMWLSLHAPLYADELILTREIDDSLTPQNESGNSSPTETREAGKWLGYPAEWFKSYLNADVSGAQIYQMFFHLCSNDVEKANCEIRLFSASQTVASALKRNGLFILYRMQSGWFQLVCLYAFVLGVVFAWLRRRRANYLLHFAENTEAIRIYLRGGYAEKIKNLSLRAYCEEFWRKEIQDHKNTNGPNQHVTPELDRHGTVLNIQGDLTYRLDLATRISHHLDEFLAGLTESLHLNKNEIQRQSAVERHAQVLPKLMVKTISAFVAGRDMAHGTAIEHANNALEHGLTEIESVISADREASTRCLELVPVIGFFGTIWGLSLAMLGANDVIRAQETNWSYKLDIFLIDESLAQQQALEGLLTGLSVAFDTTGYALVLLFFLIIWNAISHRSENRCLARIYGFIQEETIRVLPISTSAVLTLPAAYDLSRKTLNVPAPSINLGASDDSSNSGDV